LLVRRVLAPFEMSMRADVLLSSTAHDLKEPLEAIVMGASLLLRSLPGNDSSARFIAEAILRSAERANDRVDDLRDLTLMEAGAFEVRPVGQSADAMATEAIARWVRQADRRGVILQREIHRGLRVRADRTQLVRVLGKLLDNAIRFSPAGGRVLVGVERSGATAHFRITDDGPGIPQDKQSTLFERAEIDGAGITHHAPGLSLPLVRGVIELHGGKITVCSEPGKGSTFSFALALA
jgi:signal transduction histidine kinase